MLPNGKVDRRALPPPEVVVAAPGARQRPHDPVELRLVRIWEEVLGVEGIGVGDDFFGLGGCSLLAIKLFDGITNRLA